MDGEPGTPGPATTGGTRIAPVVLKILITVVVSTIAYVVTNLVNQSQDELWKLAMSIVIGGSALIVQYMVDFEHRLATTEAGQRERARELQDQLTRLGEAAGLLNDLDQAGMSTSDARRLIRSATQVGHQGPDIVRAFARAEVERLASVVTDLSGMTAYWPRDKNEWLIQLTACARRTIDATSTVNDRSFWDTDPAGGPYLAAQVAAMRHPGVTIRRLFMIYEAEERDHGFMRTFGERCERQRRLGIKVRYISTEADSAAEMRDIVIFDAAVYLDFSPDIRARYLQTMLDAKPDRVEKKARQFNELWDDALEPVLQPDASGP